jgi:F-type H+-transporting ATPase subunit a
MTYIVDPLEQFSIELVKSYHGSEISVSILPYTTIGKINLVVAILIFLIMYVDKLATLNKIKKVANILFSLILRTVRDSVEVKKNSFPILFYVLFLFILATNILGMLPYSLTATSHLIVTLFFSLAFFISNNIIGLCYHKDKYFVLFLPSGVPT